MIRADNTQRRMFEGRLSDAIARDRAAMVVEPEIEESGQIQEVEEQHAPWHLWIAISLGSMLIVAVAFVLILSAQVPNL